MPDRGILQAEQRVREMNRMTQHYAEQGNLYMQNMNSAHIPPPRFEPMGHPVRREQEQALLEQVHNHNDADASKDENDPHKHEQHRNNDRPAAMASPVNFLGIENDKLLLIAIMYLLIKENADIKLILALGYLLL